MTDYYSTVDATLWKPSGIIGTKDGRRVSARDVLANWPKAEIEANFWVQAAAWPRLPAGHELVSREVTLESPGVLFFNQITRPIPIIPPPTAEQVVVAAEIRYADIINDKMVDHVISMHKGDLTREAAEIFIAVMTVGQRDRLIHSLTI